MTEPRLRDATHQDLEDVTEIYAHAVLHGTATYELEPPTAAQMAARFDALRGGGFPYLVAEDAGAIVGYAYAGPFRERAAYRFIVENSIYVLPARQGQGIGRLLLAALVERSAAAGFRQMIAVIGDGSAASASVKLHEAMGFRYSGCLEGSGYKFGRWLDTVFMQLALNGGAALAPDPASLPERRFRGEA